MTLIKTSIGRRSFMKVSAMAGGGMVLGFSWLASCKPSPEQTLAMPKEWFKINGFLKIGENGVVTIQSPNPEIGQNVKTSMPMIVAEELGVDWKNVIVEQAPLDTTLFKRQLAGGSQAIRQGWESLRMAGATANHMLREAAATTWGVPLEEVTTSMGTIHHKPSGKTASYGEMASKAATLEVPKDVKIKDVKDFSIIGTSRRNVDGQKIVTGKPLYGLDIKREGMVIAMIIHPPAFGMELKSYDDTAARAMPGIQDIFVLETYKEDYPRIWADTISFNKQIVIVGKTTWEVLQAKKAIKTEWIPFSGGKYNMVDFWQNAQEVAVPGGLESSAVHMTKMKDTGGKKIKVVRCDGNPYTAFDDAAKILERSYTAPFLAHNTMEPMNFFADVTDEKAELIGPIQTPEYMEKSVSARLGMPLEKIDIQMTRMGGGFGRRLYGHFLVEAAAISQKIKKPVKLVYTREDDMTCGIYRPAYHVTYRAALDAANNLTAFHVIAGGIPESPLAANRFPAGAIDNYLAEEWELPSNISSGAFRAPGSNFIAGAEQAFLDELAEVLGKDPFDFRLELLDKATKTPVGDNNDYDAARYAGVISLLREKSGWGHSSPGVHRGMAAYFCHNTYVAQVVDMVMEQQKPVLQKVTAAVDCGIVVNPDAATNLAEGGIVDGLGHGLYSAMTFTDGKPDHSNFSTYHLMRHSEAPRQIDVHFVKNDIDPTGLGEPLNPPVIGAVANALYKATGTRHYDQPFLGPKKEIG